MNKRGLEITFNWIFAIIAGSMVFSFLIYFGVQHTDLFGRLTYQVVSEELDTAFSGLKTTNVETVLDFEKEVELEFKCDSGVEKLYINGKAGKTLYDNIVFVPNKKLKGSRFYLKTKEWKMPFKVTNFIFIDTEDVNIIDDDTNILDFEKYRYEGCSPNGYCYDDLKEIAIKKSKNVIDLYIAKIDKLYNLNIIANYCSFYYDTIREDLRRLKIFLDSGSDIKDILDDIEARNNELIGRGCPSVY